MRRLATATALLSCVAGASPSHAGAVARCAVRLSPGDDVQAAVDRLPVANPSPRVCLGAGEFRVRRFLSLRRDGVTLRGDGPQTVVRLEPGAESPVVVVGDATTEQPRRPTSRVTIERLRLVGGGRDGREADPEFPYLTNSAIVVRAGRHVTIRDVDVSGCRSACILTERGTRDVPIVGNRVAGAVWDGLSLNRTARARIAGNVIRQDGAAGITAEHLEDSVVENNLLTGNATHGLYLSDSYRNRIVANRIVENVLSGVFLTCAVREHAPEVRCWKNSMSQGNRFAQNVFRANRVGFTVAPNASARCTARRFVRNRSEGDRFTRNPRAEPGPPGYGRCLVVVDPR
jgi:parallel beta-helix repeat protein